MTVEITPGLISVAVGWISSALMAAWIVSRRSRQWDEIEDVLLIVFGDRRKGEPGLARDFDDLVEDHGATRELLLAVLRGLHANHPTAAEVEAAVKATVAQAASGQNVHQPPITGTSHVILTPGPMPALQIKSKPPTGSGSSSEGEGL